MVYLRCFAVRAPRDGFLRNPSVDVHSAEKNCMIDGKVLNLAFGLQLGRTAAK